MSHHSPGKEYVETSVYFYGQNLKIADNFVYLGRDFEQMCTLDDEVFLRIRRSSA